MSAANLFSQSYLLSLSVDQEDRVVTGGLGCRLVFNDEDTSHCQEQDQDLLTV